jgi:hypothetical protein
MRRMEPATTSGGVRSYFEIRIVRTTNEVPAERGVQFGIAHEFLNIPALDKVEMVVTHPDMTKPNGTTSTGFRLSWPSSQTFTTYGLDNDYEVVRGDWKFQYYFKGTLLCEQAFRTL